MEDRCRYCHAEVTYDTLVCPRCGAHLVEVERQRKWWPFVALGVGVVIAGLVVYFVAFSGSSEQPPATPPQKAAESTKTAQKAAEEEADRKALEEMDRKWQAERERREAALAEQNAWERMKGQERVTFLAKLNASLRDQVAELRKSSDPKQAEAAEDLARTLASAEAFLAAGSLDVAYESLKAIRDGIRELSPAPQSGAQGAPKP